MLQIDEALMWKWKDKICEEMDDVCASESWTGETAAVARNLLSCVEKIFCIVKCAREIDGE